MTRDDLKRAGNGGKYDDVNRSFWSSKGEEGYLARGREYC